MDYASVIKSMSAIDLCRLIVDIRHELARREAPQGGGITDDHFDYLDSLDEFEGEE